MSPKARREVGAKIAGLVWEAEQKFGPNSGEKKHRWVMEQAKKTAPKSDDPSAQFGRVLGATLLRIGIEIAVQALDFAKENLDD